MKCTHKCSHRTKWIGLTLALIAVVIGIKRVRERASTWEPPTQTTIASNSEDVSVKLNILGRSYDLPSHRVKRSKSISHETSHPQPPSPPELQQPLPLVDNDNPPLESNVQAEISDQIDMKPEVLATQETESNPYHWNGKPMLPADRPDWVARMPQVHESVHWISVGSDPADTLEQSLESMNENLLRETRAYLDKHVFETRGAAASLTELTADWIRANWLVANKQYDAIIETPSATYHQAWVELRIDPQQRQVVTLWRNESLRQERIVGLGLGAGSLVAVVGLANFVLGLGARRKTFK